MIRPRHSHRATAGKARFLGSRTARERTRATAGVAQLEHSHAETTLLGQTAFGCWGRVPQALVLSPPLQKWIISTWLGGSCKAACTARGGRIFFRVSLQPQGVSGHKQTGCPQACAPKIMLSASARLCEAPPAWLAVINWQSVSVPGRTEDQSLFSSSG